MTTRMLAPSLAALAAAVAPVILAAQGSGDSYPHGPLPEGLGCADCHTTEGWSPLDPDRSFEHEDVTGFALNGGHAEARCESCHDDLRFGDLEIAPEECGGCHLDVHQGTLPADCTRCHTPESFSRVSGVRIHLAVGFPLEGAHLQVSCESCHANDRGGAYSPLPSDCMTCHREEYEAPKAVDHVAGGFSPDCLSCHSPLSWKSLTGFDHATYSGGFPLLGNHDRLSCSLCHVLPGMETIFSPSDPEDCFACHLADYQREHAGSGYPTTCLTCHRVTGWRGLDFDHDGLFFPILTGPHEGRWSTCATCHPDPTDYRLFTCLSCHEHGKSRMDEEHSEISAYVYESGQCLSCHPRGRS